MYIEENLKEYLKQYPYVLVRGVPAMQGLKFLKNFVSGDRKFMGDVALIENAGLPYDDADTSTLVMTGNGSDMLKRVASDQPIWYFQDLGSGRTNRNVRKCFDLVLDFSDGKLLGACKSV